MSSAGEIAVDRLLEPTSSIEVVQLVGAHFGAATAAGARQPHRHDYHD